MEKKHQFLKRPYDCKCLDISISAVILQIFTDGVITKLVFFL